jgi:outer membrane receptor for ferrienterochelin and colicins
MYKLVGVVFFWLIGVSAVAQVKVTVVNQATGERMEGVSVVVTSSTNTRTYFSNEEGLVDVPAITFPATLIASHIGFRSQQLELPVAGAYTIDLVSTSAQLEEVIVTGQFEPQSVSKSVFKVKVITLETIQSKGATRLQDVLNTELNIRFSNDPALGVSNMQMQGMSGQNVKILLDGIPVIGRQGATNAFDLNQININTIERIEIIEGPMSTMYGADALAGVINIITKKPEAEKLTGSVKIHEESVGSEYSLFNEGIHQENVSASYRKSAIHALVDGGHYYSGGWQGNAEGRDRTFNPKGQWFANGSVGIDKSNWNASYRLDYLNEDIYNPGSFAGNEAIDKHFITNRFIHQLQGGVALADKVNFTGAIAYSDYNRKTQTTVVDAVTGEETLSLAPGEQDETKYDATTLRGTFQYKISDNFSLQPGYDINLESGSGERLEEGTKRIEDYAVFLSGEIKPLRQVSIRPGVRFVKNSVYDAPPALPSLNMKFLPSPDHEIRLSYGRGFRAPSIRELYFYFFDSNHSIAGNENLEAELSHSVNTSWDWHIVKSLSFTYTTTVSGFYNKMNNLITLALGAGNIYAYRNISESKTQGFVFNNRIISGGLSASAGLSYVAQYNPYVDEDPTLPEVTWSPEVNTSVSYRFVKVGLTASAFYKYTGKTPYYTINAEDQVYQAQSDEYHWADVSLQRTFIKHLDIALGVRNLFDVTTIQDTAVSSGVHTPSGARSIGSGRSFYTTLTVNF